jgi:hypothetical protein
MFVDMKSLVSLRDPLNLQEMCVDIKFRHLQDLKSLLDSKRLPFIKKLIYDSLNVSS